MIRIRLWKLAITTPLFALAINALSMPINENFERASSCAIPGAVSCSGTGLPSNFCCAASSTCITLARNTTLVCCPEGETCTRLIPVTCDVSKLNATSNPASELLTTNLDGALPTCGSACCPFGYSCYKNETCIIDADQNLSPTALSSTAVAATSITAVPTSISIPSSTTSSTPVSSTQPSASVVKPTNSAIPITASSTQSSSAAVSKSSTSAFSTKAVLIGLFPGLAAGILIAVAIFCFLGARRRKAKKSKISSPIYHPGSSVRTDFLRKGPFTPKSNTTTTPVRTRVSTIQRVRSLFHRSNASSDTLSSFASNAPVTEVARKAPQPPGPHPSTFISGARNSVGGSPHTPRLQRASSMEEINVGFLGTGLGVQGVDGLQRGSHQTSFSDMMKRADLKMDEPFVPGHRTS